MLFLLTETVSYITYALQMEENLFNFISFFACFVVLEVNILKLHILISGTFELQKWFSFKLNSNRAPLYFIAEGRAPN